MSKRTDAQYTDRKVVLKHLAGRTLGYETIDCKRGHWITFRYPDESQQEGAAPIHVGRSLGTVTAIGTPPAYTDEFEGIAVVVLSADLCLAMERWIKPEWILSCTPFPPARVLEFMCSDFTNAHRVMGRVEDGLPTGFNHYLTGDVPRPDHRWEMARYARKPDGGWLAYNRNEIEPSTLRYFYVELKEFNGELTYTHKLLMRRSQGIGTLDPYKEAAALAASFYEEEGKLVDGGDYSHRDGQIIIGVQKLDEIEPHMYTILSEYLTTL